MKKSIKTSSAKAKARELAKEVVVRYREVFGLPETDCRFTPSGVNGPDLIKSRFGYSKIPWAEECKAYARHSCFKYYDQAVKHVELLNKTWKKDTIDKDIEPIALLKQNRDKRILALVDLDYLLDLLHCYNINHREIDFD